METHRIILRPATNQTGITVKTLLADTVIRQTRIACPCCDQFVEVPTTLEPFVRQFVRQAGGQDSYIEFKVTHPQTKPADGGLWKWLGHYTGRSLKAA
jgi:hypothetical protein